MTTQRPDFVTDKHLEFLDNLRESGETNMFGAAPFVAQEFSIDLKLARQISVYWMQTFGDNNR